VIEDALQLLREASEPLLVALAGPNGAGKSTFYVHFLSAEGIPFVNADWIARDLAHHELPSEAYEAAKRADVYRRRLLERGVSFAFETVFSDPAGDKVQFLRQAQSQGYSIHLVFIGLENRALSAARVAERVERGGHDVPDEKLHERFPRTLKNLREAVAFVDLAVLLDNSLASEPFRFVAAFERGRVVKDSGLRPRWVAGLPGLDR
jgi:predicted ABC-type ATPase